MHWSLNVPPVPDKMQGMKDVLREPGGGGPRAAQLPVPRKPELLPDGGAEVVLERVPQKVEPPPLHRVVLLNDDYTPMEFVVMVLQEFFNKDRDTATQIMLQVHVHGRGVCGVYTADIAATKVDQVLKAASHAGHPLQCVSEPVD